jgi:multiple sugar transport system substrate-binding protein
MIRKSIYKSAFMILLVSMLVACSSSQNGSEQNDSGNKAIAPTASATPVAKKDPIDLTFYITSSGYTDESFMDLYGNAIKEKFPHITPKFIPTGKGSSLPELVASKTPIDIIISSSGLAQANIVGNGLQVELTDFIKKYNYDLNKLEPTLVDQVKKISGGNLYGLPYSNTIGLLTYNKELFDKFGVPYPKDGMTWDEAYDIAKRMTRSDNGVQYRGFISSVSHMVSINQFSAGFVDPTTNKALFDKNENWKLFANNLLRFYQIPGNEVTAQTVTLAKQYEAFTVDRTVAMMAHIGTPGAEQMAPFDMVTMPYYKERPGYGPQPYPTLLFVTSLSKYKDEAFQAIAHLTSEEHQLKISKGGLMSVLKSQAVRDAYAQDLTYLKGKNVKARFPEKISEASAVTPYDSVAASKLNTQLNLLIQGELDVNTALRTAAEEADKAINAAKVAANK